MALFQFFLSQNPGSGPKVARAMRPRVWTWVDNEGKEREKKIREGKVKEGKGREGKERKGKEREEEGKE
jgi:hypothetical protein